VNLPKAVRLFELASTLPLKKFVWISSGGTVYGRTSTGLIPETRPTLPLSPYGITKLAIEKYAHIYFESKGLPIVCVRPANAFGEGQRTYSGQGFIATAIASVLDGRELTLFGEQGTIRDYLHVADVATGIVWRRCCTAGRARCTIWAAAKASATGRCSTRWPHWQPKPAIQCK